MLAGKDFVAGLDDELVMLVLEPLAGAIGDGGSLLEDRIGGDHLARHQVGPDAEMLDRALRLGAPELVGGNLDVSEAVGFLADIRHWRSRDDLVVT